MLTQGDYPIVDHYKTKECALKLATDAALTVLRVDQIIMARPAGGPAPRMFPQHVPNVLLSAKQGGNWDED